MSGQAHVHITMHSVARGQLCLVLYPRTGLQGLTVGGSQQEWLDGLVGSQDGSRGRWSERTLCRSGTGDAKKQ